MVLLPDTQKTCYEERREWLEIPELVKIGMDEKAWKVGSLCHLALRHHNQGNGAGNTLKHGQSTKFLKFHAQSFTEQNGSSQIITHLKADEGYEVIHTLSHYENEKGFEVETEFLNHTSKSITLDLLTSFSLDNISPYHKADAPNALALHRYRGGWSLEGKHCVDDIENLNLERSWLCAFPEGERYGCIGSHAVKRFFSFGAVKYGKTVIYGDRSKNTRHLAGTQAVLRLDREQKTGLLVCHGFKETMKQSIEITLPSGNWVIENVFGEKCPVKIVENVLVIDHVQDFSGFACILKC